jgi:hypothetical protein
MWPLGLLGRVFYRTPRGLSLLTLRAGRLFDVRMAHTVLNLLENPSQRGPSTGTHGQAALALSHCILIGTCLLHRAALISNCNHRNWQGTMYTLISNRVANVVWGS